VAGPARADVRTRLRVRGQATAAVSQMLSRAGEQIH
jgi:hypothetical protein